MGRGLSECEPVDKVVMKAKFRINLSHYKVSKAEKFKMILCIQKSKKLTSAR